MNLHWQRGQGMVEFALVFPVVILLIVGIFDAGRAVFAYTTLDNASKTGARVAIVNQSNSVNCVSVETARCAAVNLSTGLGITTNEVSVAWVTTACATAPALGCEIKVTVSYPYSVITPIVGSVFPNINMSVSTTMRIERIYSNP